MTNNNILSLKGQNAALDADSKKKFWDSVPKHIKERSEKVGFDPTALLKYNTSTKTFFFTNKDLFLWMKNCYPNSIIQMEKVIFTDTCCQYKVKIYKSVEDHIATEIEGPVVFVNNADLFTNQQNYIGTAKTMAVNRAINYLGFGHCLDDEFTCIQNSSVQVQEQQQTEQQEAERCLPPQSIEEAMSCIIDYPKGCKSNKYKGKTVGEILKIDKMFIQQYANKMGGFIPYVKACCQFVLNYRG